jgi:fatty acid desaturase
MLTFLASLFHCLGTLTGQSEFPVYKEDDGFYKELTKRVKKYFDETGYDPKAPIGGILRMIPVFSVLVFSYCVISNILFTELPYSVKAIAAVFFGLCQVLPLLHVMHDASHAAIGHSQSWWKFFGQLTLDWIAGASMMSWHHQHIMGHHVYTNVFEADPDLPLNPTSGDPRRLVKRQKWANIYSYQHIYLPILYGLLAISVRVSDITNWMYMKNGPIRVNLYDNPWFRLVFIKLVWAAWRIVLPLFYFHANPTEFWTLFLIAELTSGYWLSWNFEVSHITTDVDYINGDKNDKSKIHDTWAAVQVKTSLDYSHDSPFATFLCGALNYQIEHHLFPGISQYYYPDIAPIVKQTCKEFNIPYRYEPNFSSAFYAHLQHLYKLGKEGKSH